MKDNIQSLYNSFTDLWKRLCDIHSELYGITCEEYLALLNSNIDQVNALLEHKEVLIKTIDDFEAERFSLVLRIAKISQSQPTNFAKFKTVYEYFHKHLQLDNENTLLKYHATMLDLIEKTQDQNKKNRIFLNKALHSIQELRFELNGVSKVDNYSRTGEKQAHCR